MNRRWLYHKDCPKGEIFEAEEAETKLLEGWVDSPAKINDPPNEPEKRKPGRPRKQ